MKTPTLLFCLIGLSMMSASCSNDKIQPGVSQTEPSTSFSASHTAEVKKKRVTQFHTAVGTIRPLTESSIEPRVRGQVVKINVAPGDAVAKGDVLVVLDAQELVSRLSQAREGKSYADNRLSESLKGVDEAQAGLEQARAAYDRTRTLFEKGIVPSQRLEIDKAAFLTAKARVERAKQAVAAARASVRQAHEVAEEARISKDYTRITAPEDGVVVRRLADPGDLAVPGKPLLEIQTSGSLRLEAHVREGLIRHIVKDKSYEVEIKTADKTVSAVVREIVPYADPDTRTFLVKANLPLTPGVYPGMFGRLRIPVGEQSLLMIPEHAVIRVGQLEMAMVQNKTQGFDRVFIKTGHVFGPDIQVLSGLNETDILGW